MVYIPTGRELIDPFKLLEDAGIRADMTVADFGCGTIGHYVFPASRLVGPEGKVYAIDILKSVLDGIAGRVKIESANNVETVWGDLERPKGVKLPDGSVDLGLLINNLFMSKQRPAMVKECARMIKPGGRLVIVDWKPAGVPFGPDQASRLTVEEVKKLAEGAGLFFDRALNPGKYHFGLAFLKH